MPVAPVIVWPGVAAGAKAESRQQSLQCTAMRCSAVQGTQGLHCPVEADVGEHRAGAHMSGATSMLATIVGALFVPSPTAASTAASKRTSQWLWC